MNAITLPYPPSTETNRRMLAIDPGTTESGWCLFDGARVIQSGVKQNETLLLEICMSTADCLAIEMISSYGMAVGREVFETCVWIGRFKQQWVAPSEVKLIYRRDVKTHLCGSVRAKDANVRQAIIDLFEPVGGGKTPQIGTKAKPGPLFGVASHAWSALGVALTAWNQ